MVSFISNNYFKKLCNR